METEFQFEHPYGDGLTGRIEVTVEDPNHDAYPPPRIIQRDHAWQINVEWTIKGRAAPTIGGDWKVSAFVESIGPGLEAQVGETQIVSVDFAPVASTRSYEATIDVPAADTIVDFNAGAYWLTILINYENLGVPGEIAGVVELPIMQFYDAT